MTFVFLDAISSITANSIYSHNKHSIYVRFINYTVIKIAECVMQGFQSLKTLFLVKPYKQHIFENVKNITCLIIALIFFSSAEIF